MSADGFIQELLRSLRSLLRRPRYLFLVTLTLAVGVAAASITFSLIYHKLLRPLPFVDSGRLIAAGVHTSDGSVIASPALRSALAELPGLDAIGLVNAYTRQVSVAVAAETPVVARVLAADRGFLQSLQVIPTLGRNFDASETEPGGERVVLLSHRFWQEHLGADPDVLGAPLAVEGLPFVVVGVLPLQFRWLNEFDLLAPLMIRERADQDMGTNQYLVGRMAAGLAVPALSAQVATRAQGLVEALRAVLGNESYDFFRRSSYGAIPLRTLYQGDLGPTLWMFFAAALCVLLVASFNLANLFALRAVLRTHDNAVRAALGATRWKLVSPGLAEALIVGVCGAIVGAGLAWGGTVLLGRTEAAARIQFGEAGLSAATVSFCLAIGLAVAIVAAVAANLRAAGTAPAAQLMSGMRIGLALRGSRLGRLLVTAQVATSVVLLVTASLFMRSLVAVASVPMGFESAGITTFTLSPLRGVYVDDASVKSQTRSILEHLQNQPWVERAAVSTHLPTGARFNFPARLEDGTEIQPQYRPISSDFFSTFQIPMRVGRAFDDRDLGGTEPVCVVNEAFASQHLDGQPLGRYVAMGRDAEGRSLIQMRVVGVVADLRQYGPTVPPPAILYVPFEQVHPAFWPAIREFGPLSYALKLAGPVRDQEALIRAVVEAVSSQQAIAQVRSMDQVVEQTMAGARLQLSVVGVFAMLSLTLAGVGLYAVLALNISSRMHEYGVRAALGARRADLVRVVLREGGMQVGIGLLLGLALALIFAGLLRGFLFGIGVRDPTAIILVLLVLGLVAVAAMAGPALRAARADPARALRDEP